MTPSLVPAALHRLSFLVHVPESPALSSGERRRAAIVQFCNLVGIASIAFYNLLYLLADARLLWPLVLAVIPPALLFVASFALNRRGRLFSAKIVFNVGLTASMFIATGVFLGPGPGIHIYFLLFAVIPLLVWSFRDWAWMGFFVAVNLSCFLYVQAALPLRAPLVRGFPEAWLLPFRALSILTVFTTIAGILAFFQYRSERDEEELRAKADAMEVLAERFESQARVDSLTGLLNRRSMLECLKQEVLRVNRSAETFCVVIADLDDFKLINDRYGHDCGDSALRAVADAMRRSLRESDRVARWGGEEFCFLLPETALTSGAMMAERLRSVVAETAVAAYPSVSLTVTLGVAAYAAQTDVDDTIRAADEALYRGKADGRNRVAICGAAAAMLPSAVVKGL